MIRKWSYINNTTTLINKSSKISLKYSLKVFRQNTRFKNFNQGFTYFSRKIVMLRQRRIGWKTYFITSSVWAKYTLTSKKLISFVQSKLLTNFTVTYTYTNMLKNKSNIIKLIGMGDNPINFTFSKNIFLKFYLLNYSNTKINNKLLLPTAQFNSLSVVYKLKNLGFSFKDSIFLKNSLPLNNNVIHNKSRNSTPLTILNNKLSLNSIINKLTSLRLLHTYLILKLTN